MALVRLIAALLLLWPSLAMAQVQQSGTVTPGHPTMWTTNGVVQDAGTSSQGKLTTLGITSSNLQSQCINNGPATGPYNSLCFGINGAQAQITLSNFGGAPAIPLQCVVNGVTSNCLSTAGSFLPLSGGTLSGPLILSGDPTLSLGAATKHYVDTSLPVGGPFLPIVGGTLTGPLSLTGPNGSSANPGLRVYPTLHADGVTSDDAALQAAINACSNAQGTVVLPPGKILLTGAAGSITLSNCFVKGTDVSISGQGGIGTTILLTSTTVKPFIIQQGWKLQGMNFVWPNQTTGTTVYPPLLSDDGVNGAGFFHIDHIGVVNAYDFMSQTVSGPGWGNFFISNSDIWAVHDAFQLSSVGDSVHFSNVHFTPGQWIGFGGCGGVCQTAVNAAFAAGNSLFHARAGSGIQVEMDNSATFAWRNVVLVDSNASVSNSYFDGIWDGVGTMVDASAANAKFPVQNRITGIGLVCGISVPYAGGPYPGNNPCFLMGANSGLDLRNLQGGAHGDLVSTAGSSPIILRNNTLGLSGTVSGPEVAIVNVTAGNPEVIIQDNRLTGSTHSHGFLSATAPVALTVQNNFFLGFVDGINSPWAQTRTTVEGNGSASTTGANTVVFTGAETGKITYSANFFDKPTSPVLSESPIYGNLVLTRPSIVDFSNGSIGPPSTTATSNGTRERFFTAGFPDYSFGIETGNVWSAVPSITAVSLIPGNGWKFYGGSTDLINLDAAGNIFGVGRVHSSTGLEVGSASISSAVATTTFDVPGNISSTVAVNAAGSGYLGTDILYDGFGGLYSITVDGSGALLTIAMYRVHASVSGAAPCTTACALEGGAGAGATVNLTWTAGTTIDVGPTSATRVNLGRSGQNTTVVGLFNLPGIVTAADCTGQPSKSIIATTGTGVLLQCP